MKINIMWFRRDLRLEDNTALLAALQEPHYVLPLFIFDSNILGDLPKDDARVSFIHHTLQTLNNLLSKKNSGLVIKHGTPEASWNQLLQTYQIDKVFINRDYEPYAITRDQKIQQLLNKQNISLVSFKDQVMFEPHEVLKKEGLPYTVFTPYKRKWLATYLQKNNNPILTKNTNYPGFIPQNKSSFPTIESIGFLESPIKPNKVALENMDDYDQLRDLPAKSATTFVGTSLRFGTLSIRNLVKKAYSSNPIFLSELIWREFFNQILFHYPKIVHQNYKKTYDQINWRNNPKEFKAWCSGHTGYPLVDAGMRQLNSTGYMHNRVRMVSAGFLCKHLLIDWRWGEAYFASKLLDYELASNNGNWQWAAGTGCDAAPYFRIFNPIIQAEKFDPQGAYIRKWIPEWDTTAYPKPIVDHKEARLRAIQTYKKALETP